MRKVRELTPEEQAALKAVDRLPDDRINLEDVPEVRDWSRAERGRLYRPVKQHLSMRLDADVVEWFKAHSGGEGYQTRINRVLREYVMIQLKHEREPKPR
jgi:uncharacterized protein (DUF4415 family)